MTTAALAPPAPTSPVAIGRTYVSPAFDYLLIGGGLSLIVTALLVSGGFGELGVVTLSLPLIFFLSNAAHFAASTVRLYTKPGAFVSHRFLTMGLPLVTVLVLSLALLAAESVGPHLQALYLTWSPFHYAAQAYGLAVMYCYRSGCSLGVGDKRLVRAACLLPFLAAFTGGHGSGLGWFLPARTLASSPLLLEAHGLTVVALEFASLAAPLLLFVMLGFRHKGLPLISLLVIVSNGIWWVTLRYIDAFVWATIFHGIQYLAISVIFYVKEQAQQPGNAHGWLYHSARFYGWSLLLGYLLFTLWPRAYVAFGFGWAESFLLVVAAINIHHFVVDAYIWRLRRDPNYQVVTGGAAAPA